VIYVDTSALLKLLWIERGSAEMAEFVSDRDLTSSSLLAVEMRRGVVRAEASALPRADVLLTRVALVAISDAVVESASRLPDALLRSLDAIHLATALMLAEELEVLLSYDDRLLAAAVAHDLPVAAPGR
jgi:predicted nucleic acid-binding protein